jgi:hypothetical protein
MTSTAFQRCEYLGCPLLATGYVEAQWTIADFRRYEACDAHLWDIREDLVHQRVEGLLPVMSLGWYD